ncbi:hypothetical protein G6L37_13740 [Agrobacterium rubi]|uniref:hypothetical protein n=1 Tax=Agrobacterium rubi TaxID=28099 RepID=UPI00157473AB|nr:hypothetical protein [Agrobacterium rubi]NTF07209.1 hypothetical protein [Agrobacterium rubi]NTF19465.1 hypothetical protein [Agrobacterium rubi]NTF26428.1 hypothetical protein [Agrobacterium rubi]
MATVTKANSNVRLGRSRATEKNPAYRVVENELRVLHASIGQATEGKWTIASRSKRARDQIKEK